MMMNAVVNNPMAALVGNKPSVKDEEVAPPKFVLFGHDLKVNSVAINLDLDIVVSGSEDHTCIVHSAKDGTYIRTLPFRGPVLAVRLTDDGDIITLSKNLSNESLSSKTLFSTKNPVRLENCEYSNYSVIRHSMNGALLAQAEFDTKISAFECTVDGQFLILGGENGYLAVRNLNLNLVRVFDLTADVATVCVISGISENESWLVAGTPEGKLFFFPFNMAQML